jgi:replication factor C subunit 3/5
MNTDINIPLTEKYRPKTLSDIISQENTIKIIKECIKQDKLPHMLFYGPPGTGKTSTILAISRTYFGDSYKSMILELNGSDDRGLNVIRSQIKTFAKIKNISNDKPKIVILDEADSLTIDAQFALRRVIEKYTRNVRFCLICNYLNKVISAVQSRCMIFKFSTIGIKNSIKKIKDIMESEKIMGINNNTIEKICNYSEGDFRKVLNLIQQRNFDDNFIIEYFYHVKIDNYNICYHLLKNPKSFNETLTIFNKINEEYKINFDDFLIMFTDLGIKLEKYEFLNNLSEIEYNFYCSTNSFGNFFLISLCSILSI